MIDDHTDLNFSTGDTIYSVDATQTTPQYYEILPFEFKQSGGSKSNEKHTFYIVYAPDIFLNELEMAIVSPDQIRVKDQLDALLNPNTRMDYSYGGGEHQLEADDMGIDAVFCNIKDAPSMIASEICRYFTKKNILTRQNANLLLKTQQSANRWVEKCEKNIELPAIPLTMNPELVLM